MLEGQSTRIRAPLARGSDLSFASGLSMVAPLKFATSSEQLLRVIHYRDGSLIVLLMLTQDELIDNVMMLQFLS